MWRVVRSFWVVVACLCSVCGTAAAQEAPESPQVLEARSRFARAEQHYADGEFALSQAELQRVFDLMRDAGHANAPLILFNIARCFVELGRDGEAVEHYERYLAEAPAGAPNIEVARNELRELRARLALEGTADVENGISPIGPIVAAIGAAAMIGGAITGGLALTTNDDAMADCVGGHCPEELGPRADEAHMLANVTDGLLFGGLAVAATGVLLVFLLPGEGSSTAVSAGCAHDGCGLTVVGTY